MDITVRASSTAYSIPLPSPLKPHGHHLRRTSLFGVERMQSAKIVACALSSNGAVPRPSPDALDLFEMVKDPNRQRSNLGSLFCYDKSIPEEIIEKPIGLGVPDKLIGDNPRCPDCQAKGVVPCNTCSGSGLYVDSILESQGIIVKVRCLGCGGTGNILCSDCGVRGYV